VLTCGLMVGGAGCMSRRRPKPAQLGRFRQPSLRMPAPPEPIPDVPLPPEEPEATNLPEQRRRLFLRMQHEHHLSDGAIGRVREIFEHSNILGQGNPSISQHLLTRKECRERRAAGLMRAVSRRTWS
jgi:hypothetical protein